MAEEEEKIKESPNLEEIINKDAPIMEEEEHPEQVPEKGWTESIMNRIEDLAAPLTERFWTHSETKKDQDNDTTESVFQKIADIASSPSDDDSNADDDDESILQRITNLASPLTDLMESQTKEEPEVVASKENVLQKVAKRFDKKTSADIVEPSWKDKVVDKLSNITLPLVDRLDVPVTLQEMDISDLSRNHVLVGAAGALILLLFLFVRRRRSIQREQTTTQAQRRARSPTKQDGRARSRSGSLDAFLRKGSFMRDRTGTADEAIDEALKNDTDTPLVFGGPGVPSISFQTWSPPLQWSEASRMLLPVSSAPEHQRKLTLNFQDGTLTREEHGGQSQTYDMKGLSINVKSPATGGVLELYEKGAPKEEWIEHTFESAHQAAQFQQDLVNYQVVGDSVKHMYESLELIQKGSLGHDGKECVLHDDTSDSKKGAVAWDDCMRCFSGIKPIRKALELDQLRRMMGDNEEREETAVAEDYVDKRLLLGRFDFYRLFVPNVEPTALPQSDSSPERVTELLERRKRVANAAVLVQGFVQARTVANKGWNLPIALPDESFTKRLAYDEDFDNVQRDSTAKNEYYEASVSRDVRCDVHSAKHLEKHGSSVMSQYQAFSLIGSQVFKLPPKGERHPVSHRKDPVLSLPSLRKMVEAYPELDFFVCAFFPDGLGISIVHVFVRSLPKGVDASFDTILDRFMNGTAEVRRRKLEVFIQLGAARLSPLTWAALKTVSLLLSWSRRGEAQIPFESGAERTPFPGMNLSNYTETTHFGGSLQTDPNLPTNYVAVTTHVDSSKMNAAMRVLYQRLEEGGLSASIVDFTFVLEGEQADELPERALGTIRLVHLDALKVALPTYYSASQHPTDDDESIPEDRRSAMSPLTPIIREMSVVWNTFMGSTRDLGSMQEPLPAEAAPQTPSNGNSRDPFQAGVDALRDILRGVTVPVRCENVSSDDSVIPENGDDGQISVEKDTVVKVPVLSRTSTDDLRRYFRATGCDLKEAAVRIVESAAWRGVTFPIDTRKCRVELQSGQFFQQGRDVDGDPVFYFQNMLLGPWRGKVDASVAALLHRLESSLVRLSEENPEVKCTVIALVGKPFKRKPKKRKERQEEENDESSAVEPNGDALEDGEQSAAESASVAAHTMDQNAWNPFRMGANPRVYPEEDFHVHSNNEMFYRLAELLTAHYPERLKRLILVPGQGRSVTYMNSTFTMRKLITSSRTRAKIIHLNRASELPKYVEDNELATNVGGWVEVDEEAFEC